LPVYGTVFGVAALFRARKSLQQPTATAQHVLMSTLRSTTFLSSFVAACMALVCFTRRAMPREMSWAYWMLAFVASGTIYIERKSRRAELALYVLPRALDSAHLCLGRQWPLLMTLAGRKRLALFALSCAALFRYYTHQADVLHPLLVKVVDTLYKPLSSAIDNNSNNDDDDDNASDDDLVVRSKDSVGQTPLPV
jgi:hypothetical protein